MDKQSVVLGCGCEVFGDEAQELKQRFKLLRLLIASTALSMPLLWNLPPMVQLVFARAWICSWRCPRRQFMLTVRSSCSL